jgi:hypothetical protein
MTLKELNTWIQSLPEEMQEYPLVIREVKEVEDGKFGHKDAPIASAMVDKENKRVAVFDPSSVSVINKIREMNKPQEETKIEGSNPEAGKE